MVAFVPWSAFKSIRSPSPFPALSHATSSTSSQLPRIPQLDQPSIQRHHSSDIFHASAPKSGPMSLHQLLVAHGLPSALKSRIYASEAGRFAARRIPQNSLLSTSRKYVTATRMAGASRGRQKLWVGLGVSGLICAWYATRYGLDGVPSSPVHAAEPPLSAAVEPRPLEPTIRNSSLEQLFKGSTSDVIHRRITNPTTATQLKQLDPAEVTALLRKNQKSFVIGPGRGITRYDVVQFACNDPIEDDHSEAFVPSPQSGKSGWAFFGIYDGHLYVSPAII